jgi:DNA polymerase III epsilon subunit-like protein
MDNRNLCVFDFETSSADPSTTQILQIGACIINRNSLEVQDQYTTVVQPDDFTAVDPDALRVNGLTIEQLEKAPCINTVFPTFARWVQRFNIRGDKSSFGAPIPVTWGGDRFDLPILERYCQRFNYWDVSRKHQILVNPVFSMDVMKHMWFWTRTRKDVANVKLATILEWMGVSMTDIEKGAHDAMWDTLWTARIAVKLLQLSGNLVNINEQGVCRLNMKNCFTNKNNL